MLAELRIRDLAIIDGLDLDFRPGLQRADRRNGRGQVDHHRRGRPVAGRPGFAGGGACRRRAYRGRRHLSCSPQCRERLAPLLAENGLEGDQPDLLVLAREVRANGRSVARVNGRAVNTGLLGEVGGTAGRRARPGRTPFAAARARARRACSTAMPGWRRNGPGRRAGAPAAPVRRDLEGLRQDERERARRIDLLTYQVDEIAAAAPGTPARTRSWRPSGAAWPMPSNWPP